MTSLTFSVADVLYVGTIKDIPDERVSFRPPQLSLFMRDCAGPTKGKGHGIFQKEEKVGKNTASSQKLLLLFMNSPTLALSSFSFSSFLAFNFNRIDRSRIHPKRENHLSVLYRFFP